MHTDDHAQSRFYNGRYVSSMQTARIYATQLLNKGINTLCEYSFVTNHYEIYLPIKDRKFDRFFLQIFITQKSVCATYSGPLGEIGKPRILSIFPNLFNK